jgi:hypothetical protein
MYTMNICCADNEFEISWSARLCEFLAPTRSMLSLKTLQIVITYSKSALN